MPGCWTGPHWETMRTDVLAGPSLTQHVRAVGDRPVLPVHRAVVVGIGGEDHGRPGQFVGGDAGLGGSPGCVGVGADGEFGTAASAPGVDDEFRRVFQRVMSFCGESSVAFVTMPADSCGWLCSQPPAWWWPRGAHAVPLTGEAVQGGRPAVEGARAQLVGDDLKEALGDGGGQAAPAQPHRCRRGAGHRVGREGRGAGGHDGARQHPQVEAKLRPSAAAAAQGAEHVRVGAGGLVRRFLRTPRPARGRAGRGSPPGRPAVRVPAE